MIGNVLTGISNFISLLSNRVKDRIYYLSKLKVVSLETQQPLQGNMLLSYRIEPFLLKPGEPIPNDQSWNWECLLIAQTFLDLGYNVDVIQFHNNKAIYLVRERCSSSERIRFSSRSFCSNAGIPFDSLRTDK